MDLREQLYVMCIAECESISRAAEKLHITQPALSTFLRKLEERLNVKLFERQGKKLSPTPIGKVYIQKAAAILKLGHEFSLSLSQYRNPQILSLKIGIQLLRAPRIAPYLRRRFKEQKASLHVDFAEGNDESLLQMLTGGDVDMVITSEFAHLKQQKLASYVLRRDTLLLAAAENDENIARAATATGKENTIDLKNVHDEVFFLLTPGHLMRRVVDEFFRTREIAPARVQEVYRHEEALQMASFGEGIAFTLDSYLPYFQPAGRIRFYAIDGVPPVPYSVMFKKDRFEEAQIRPVLRILKHAFTTIV